MVFVVDETDDTNFDLVQKLIYNIIRLFRPGTVKATIVGFGIRPRLVSIGVTYPKVKNIQDGVIRFQPRANKRLYIGRALNYVRTQIVRRMAKNIPRVIINVLQGSSSDNFKYPVGVLQGLNIRMITIGEYS